MFKKAISYSVLAAMIFISACTSYDFSEKFATVPSSPSAGDKVTVLYNPAETLLKDSKSIDMVVYFYSDDLQFTDEFEMNKSGEGWVADVVIPDTIYGLAIKFSDGKFTDNNKTGYSVYTFGSDGKPSPEALAGWAAGSVDWMYFLDVEGETDAAFEMFKGAFQIKPELKPDFASTYIRCMNSALGAEGKDKVLAEMDGISESGKLKDGDFYYFSSMYGRLGEMEKSEKMKTAGTEKFPNGQFARSAKFGEFRQMSDAEQMKSFIKENEELFDDNYLNYMHRTVLNKIKEDNGIDAALEYIEENQLSSSNYNSIAWSMFEDNADLNKASEIAEKGIAAARSELKNPTDEQPAFYSKSAWMKSKQTSLAFVLDTYASIQEKLGNNEAALTNEKEAFDLTEGEEKQFCENYSRMLITAGKNQDAKNILEAAVASGEKTENMPELLAQAYAAVNGSEEGFDAYYAKLEESAMGKMFAELKEKMINEPAPQFELKDIAGNSVSLAGLKGKTIVVDFWATWCGPCKSSFPGMKKAVEKFADDDKVEFLFVNTWERVENKIKNADDFVKTNNYPFHVLMDVENKVVADFKVSGIPTKFIIDGNGNIRFKSVGFGGDTEALVSELGTMIALASE